MQQADKTDTSRQNTGNTNYATPKLKLIKTAQLYTSNRLVMELALKTNTEIYRQNSSVCTIALAHGTELAQETGVCNEQYLQYMQNESSHV